ncbi:zinc finger CCHC domain-containing protein 3-like [Xenopus tropicalis]|uniref:Zinc finger CCHC domain-containing protein 3-like n=1 Tax=Xenopus tropicalis TaxID=8364 RepID=A0A8J1JTA2_XENTR|nr:zinc finger CCHC domain-containing protein 3-like [Xenopus tropicalis]
MAAREDSVPVFIRVRNSVRIVADVPSNLEQNLAYIVHRILEEFGRVSRREILAIQDYPKRGVYDVTFDGEGVYKSFLSILEENPEDPRLKGFKIFPHFAEEEVFLVVKSYSPFVPLKEIEVVIGRYCKKLSFVGKILNELGIWTSKYRFKAVFQKGMYPPARFRLGTVNIDCYFNGMPEFCKRCRQHGHVMEGCNFCQNCGKEGHAILNCTLPRKCNFCLQEGHLYATCPKRKVKPEKVVKVAGKLSLPVEPVPMFSGEENIGQASQEGPTVKRVKPKEKKRKKEPEDTEVSASSESVVTVVESFSRGEKLFEAYKEKSNKEIAEILEAWSDEEEFQGIHECISKTPENKDVRAAVLSHIRKFK